MYKLCFYIFEEFSSWSDNFSIQTIGTVFRVVARVLLSIWPKSNEINPKYIILYSGVFS